MNKERLLKVAEVVEQGQYKFNGIHAAFLITHWVLHEKTINRPESFVHYLPKREDVKDPYACNTVACIAGFACLIYDYEAVSENPVTYNDPGNVDARAQAILELTDEQAHALFTGIISSAVTGPQAARVIRHFVETGVIDWDDVRNEISTSRLNETVATE